MSHKLKMHFWHNGTLVTQEHTFENFERAVEFSSYINKPSLLRIYNEYNELVYSIDNIETEELVYG